MLLSNKTLYIVSDLHIGDHSNSDNFYPAQDRFLSFLEFIEKQENAQLIINGDCFEFWQASMADVFYRNYELLERLIKNDTIFIAGNHDYDLISLSKLPFMKELNVVKNLDISRKDGKIIKIMHGHEFDPFNQPGKAAFIGKLCALLFEHIEDKFPNSGIESWADKHLEPVARKIVLMISNIYKRLFTNEARLNGKLSLTLDQYNKQNPNHIIVAGHIHRVGWKKDFYVNDGCWLNGDPAYYLKIDINRSIKLYSWPDQKEIKQEIEI